MYAGIFLETYLDREIKARQLIETSFAKYQTYVLLVGYILLQEQSDLF